MSQKAKSKAVMLLSSGLDSSLNLAWAVLERPVVCALTFNYGQVAAQREIEFSKKLCEQFKVPHIVLDLPWFSQFSKSSLSSGVGIPLSKDISIDDLQTSQRTAKSVWVPNRNGIFLNIAAGFAEGFGADVVIAGFNREEATTFPDNSQDFLDASEASFKFSTANHVRAESYTINMDKTLIVKKALELKFSLNLVWPCYQNLKTWCGQCESCQRFDRALSANGIDFKQLADSVEAQA